MTTTISLADLASKFDTQQFQMLHEEMTYSEYIEKVVANPKLARSAYQRIYDMIVEEGHDKVSRFKRTYNHWKFFDDSEIPIFGLEDTLSSLVKFIRGAAGGYGTEKRVLLLHGPVGSSKSTICRLLKRGLERYSQTDAGAWYSYRWVNLPTGKDGIYTQDHDDCPMHEDPLKLIPEPVRSEFVGKLNEILIEQTPEEDRKTMYRLKVEGDLNPRCGKFVQELLLKYDGDWQKVMDNHIRVVRKVYSESKRQGIATFQPKDEKNQDATELTGDINYAQIVHFGCDSDPRAFNFDGEFCVGNRGIIEFIEVLKLAKEFLYDLLGASQERQIKPKKFPQIAVDTVLVGHTNHPEYAKLQNDPTMEALRDRTVKIDVPYLLEWSNELKVLEQDYSDDKVRQHVAPHTLRIAALWAILTRLQPDKDQHLSLVNKAKLYDGQSLPGWTSERVRELQDKYPDEGMESGVSARYVQDKISNCLSDRHDYINPFMVLNEIREGLDDSALITNKEEASRYMTCADLAQKELDDILKNEVQEALVGDKDTIKRLCASYIDNVMAYLKNAKVKNPYTGQDQEADERLMRSIEERIGITDAGADDFRRMLQGFIGDLAHTGETFSWDSNPELKKALEAKLFEDTKDHIKLSALSTDGASVVDPQMQEKIDAIKKRLIDQYGYNHESATDVLNYVGSIFSRGELSEDD